MRKALPLFLVLVMCMALPLIAGDEAAMAPPAPLDDATFKWMVGEWTGTCDSPMGVMEEWMRCEIALGGQFLMMQYKAKMPATMGGGDFEGQGALTLVDGALKGYWVDSWRDMSEGTGTMEKGEMSITWTGKMGPHKRVTERISDDQMVTHITMMGPDGNEMQMKSEMTRVKQMGAR